MHGEQLHGEQRPLVTNSSQTTAHAAWDAANQDTFTVQIFSMDGSAFFVVWRFEGTTLEDGAGHGREAWAAMRETFNGSSSKAIHAERAKMNNTPMRSRHLPRPP